MDVAAGTPLLVREWNAAVHGMNDMKHCERKYYSET